MEKIKKITLIICMCLLVMNCDNDNDPTNNVCENYYVTNLFTTIYSAVNGYQDLPEYMDLETHEYTIKINEDGEICTIGYQNPSTYTGSYLMEVINVTSNTSYTGTHTFSQAGLDYQSIATPVVVSSGDVIKVVRTITPGYTNLDQTVGRILRKNGGGTVPYPITEGKVEFLSSNFYGAGGPVQNFGQPYIALGFKVN